MPFDGFVMAAVAAELAERAAGALVDQVYQPGDARIVLALTGRGPRHIPGLELRDILFVGAPLDAKGLINTFNGFSPFAADEVLARAGASDPPPVAAALQALMARVTAREFEPMVFTSEEGTAADFW